MEKEGMLNPATDEYQFNITSMLLSSDITVSSITEASLKIDDLLESVIKHPHAVNCHLLASYIRKFAIKDINELVGKLPYMLDLIANNEAEVKGLLDLFDAILSLQRDDINTQLQNMVSRLVQISLKIISSRKNVNLGLNLLLVLSKSRFRSFFHNHLKSIQNTCLNLIIDLTIDLKLIAKVFSSFLSIDSNEQFNEMWVKINYQCYLLLKRTKSKSFSLKILNHVEVEPLIDYNCVDNKVGIEKSVFLQHVFNGFFLILQQMLEHGCSAGPVSIDFSVFLPIFNAIMYADSNIPSINPKSSIVNEDGFSLVSFSLLVSSLKLGILPVVETILKVNPPTLKCYSSGICRPIMMLIHHSETLYGAKLHLKLMRVLSLAARSFPSVIANHLNLMEVNKNSTIKSENGLIQQLINAIFSVVRSNELLSDQAINSKTENETENEEIDEDTIEVIINTSESILLFCGSYLSHEIRQIFELIVAESLSCLSKGLLPQAFVDRRVRQAAGAAFLRRSPRLQLAVLKLASTEILTPLKGIDNNVGMGSGNISGLKRICELILLSSNNEEMVLFTGRALLQINSIIQPTMVFFPAFPATDLALSFLARLKEKEQITTTSVMNEVEQRIGEAKSDELATNSDELATKSDELLIKSDELATISDELKKNENDDTQTITTEVEIEKEKDLIGKRKNNEVMETPTRSSSLNRTSTLTSASSVDDETSISENGTKTRKRRKTNVESEILEKNAKNELTGEKGKRITRSALKAIKEVVEVEVKYVEVEVKEQEPKVTRSRRSEKKTEESKKKDDETDDDDDLLPDINIDADPDN